MGLIGRVIDGVQSIPQAHSYSMFSFLGPVLDPMEWVCPEHLGFKSFSCGLALGVFIRPCTNGVSHPRPIASVVPLNKPQTALSQRAPYIEHLEAWLV